MKKKNRLTPEQRRERRRIEAENRLIFEEEGFTEEEIRFMSKPTRKMLLEKHGRG